MSDSRKRKLDEILSDSLSRDIPLSAVAAARASVQQVSAPVRDLNGSSGGNLLAIPGHLRHGADVNSSLVDEEQPEPLYYQSGEAQVDFDSDNDPGSHQELPWINQKNSSQNIRLNSRKLSASDVVESTKEYIILKLSDEGDLAILGQYDLKITEGRINFYGATLDASSNVYRVFAPSTHAIPLIKHVGSKPALLQLRSCEHTMRPLSKLSPSFNRIWNYRAANKDGLEPSTNLRTFTCISEASDDPWKRYLTPLLLPPSWQLLLEGFSVEKVLPPPTIVVCGPKASGKSTLCRLLTNRLLTARAPNVVFYLDLDPGQPEFTPPGILSLTQIRRPNFGPPYTHPVTGPSTAYRTERSHCLAALSPMEDEEHFLACAFDLFRHYRDRFRTFPHSPLIINCPGWIVHSGLELTTRLIRSFQCTDVVYTSVGHADIVQAIKNAMQPTSKFHSLHSQPSLYMTRTPADLRAMQLLSYFHQGEPLDGNLQWLAKPITHLRPWVINYGKRSQDICAIISLGEYMTPEFLATVIEGSIVAIVIGDAHSTLDQNHQDHNILGARSSLDRIALRLARLNAQAHGEAYEAPVHIRYSDAELSGIDIDKSLQGEKQSQTEHDGSSEGVNMFDVLKTNMSVRRTSREQLPFMQSVDGVSVAPPDPRTSQCYGLAVVRGIDVERQQLHLLTPLAEEVVDDLRPKPDKTPSVFLVHGKLDNPAWAYQEDLIFAALEANRRRKQIDESGDERDAGLSGPDDSKATSKIPWVSQSRNKGKVAGERVLRRHRGP